jgi:hypothetical protein
MAGTLSQPRRLVMNTPWHSLRPFLISSSSAVSCRPFLPSPPPLHITSTSWPRSPLLLFFTRAGAGTRRGPLFSSLSCGDALPPMDLGLRLLIPTTDPIGERLPPTSPPGSTGEPAPPRRESRGTAAPSPAPPRTRGGQPLPPPSAGGRSEGRPASGAVSNDVVGA